MSFKKLLNKTCDIQQAAKTQNAAGQVTDTYTTIHTSVKCRLRNRDTSERIHSDKQYQKATHALYLEYLNLDITKIRINMEDAIYTVTGSIDMGGSGRYLCLYLERYY